MIRRTLAIAGTLVLIAVAPGSSRAEDLVRIRGWNLTADGGRDTWLPAGISVDASYNVYVVLSNNAQVQKYDANGTLLTQWGGYGFGPGQFDFPRDVAVSNSGYVYVTDGHNHRVQQFSNTGVWQRSWGTSGSPSYPWGTFYWPRGVAASTDGKVYVADDNLHRVQTFSAGGVLLDYWYEWVQPHTQPTDEAAAPMSVAVSADSRVYVADQASSWKGVQVYDGDGNYQFQFGTRGTGPGQFTNPTGIAVNGSGQVFVADDQQNRVQVFDAAGTFLSAFGSGGSEPGQFQGAIDVACQGDLVFVLDRYSVQVFGPTSIPATPTSWGRIKADYR